MTYKRILWVDNLKAFLILLVVLGHVIQYSYSGFDSSHVFNFIYSFHMPLFFALSGFVSYKTVERIGLGGLKKRCLQLLTPYLIWTLLLCLISGIDLMVGYFESPVYWFLILLFFISIIMTICQRIAFKLKLKSEWICGATTLILFGVVSILKPSVLSLNIIHVHFFFYVLGWFLRKNENDILKNWIIIPSGIATALLGWFYQRGSIPFGLTSVPPTIYFILSGFAGTMFEVNPESWTQLKGS